jgi:hypothetical protein
MWWCKIYLQLHHGRCCTNGLDTDGMSLQVQSMRRALNHYCLSFATCINPLTCPLVNSWSNFCNTIFFKGPREYRNNLHIPTQLVYVSNPGIHPLPLIQSISHWLCIHECIQWFHWFHWLNDHSLVTYPDVYSWLLCWKMKKDVVRGYIIVNIMAFVHLIHDVQQCLR